MEDIIPTTTATSSSSYNPITSLATPTSFPFPYPHPYDIQLDLMKTVFQGIENGKIVIVESPTGTGKSLTLLTSTLSWLIANQSRMEEGKKEEMIERLKDGNDGDWGKPDPTWVLSHLISSQLSELRRVKEERKERLRMIREKERGREENGRRYKRIRLSEPSSSSSSSSGVVQQGEETFLPDDFGEDVSVFHDREKDVDGITPEVRKLMEKYQGGKKKEYEEEIEENTKIFYTSRTHTQLRQLTSELLKTTFASSPSPTQISPSHLLSKMTTTTTTTATTATHQSEPIRTVPLAGRRQLCINPKIRALGKFGDERMNEGCLELQKGGKKGCEYLPGKEEVDKILDFRDSILATVKDIEDIVTDGKERKVCPYYGTRKAISQAELVTLPYNLILQKNARDALGIKVKDQVVVIDEAHNLIDTLLSIHSLTLPLQHIITAYSQLKTYHERFRNRFKPTHALHIRQAMFILAGLARTCQEWDAEAKQGNKEVIMKVNDLVAKLGGGGDQVNLVEMVDYLKGSHLARKVSGYAEKQAIDAAQKAGNKLLTPSNAISAFHQVEAFLLSLTDANDDGRILLSSAPTSDHKYNKVTLKYILLNPAEHFKVLVEDARCIILAGGTMEPISDFLLQLFPSLPRERISTLSCAHVIPPSNLLTQVITHGPSKKEFEFKMDRRGDRELMLELGALISSLINLIPDGVVVFFPSYVFLEKVKDIWQSTGLLAKLNQRKKLFYEPQSGADVDDVLSSYSQAILNPTNDGTVKRTGALLFAVVGAKLSEGINFSDRLGRAVIMVGLPFANLGSVELKERMRYVETLPGSGKNAGQELYENLCMRAVNQSIGRAIRHANDYATLLLVDKRYAAPRISSKLPKWIGADLKTGGFGDAVRGVAGFFKGKRGQ